ncbi:MAG TPA: type II secretion system F family protein [Clostridiales bacterium]|nr:type II secretion system F family protein [Clostridiales bacterium]
MVEIVYVIATLIFLASWALTSAVLFLLFYREKPIDKLKHFDEEYVFNEKLKSHKKNKISLLKLISNSIPYLKLNKKQTKKLEIELVRADLPITAEELLVIKIFSSSAFAFLVYALSKNYITAVMLFIIIWNTPKIFIAYRKKERIKLFDSQLNEGITIISNSLKAGYSFLQAVAVVTEETKDPFSKEFKKLLIEMSLGIPEEGTFANLLSRMESEDLRLTINAILIQKDVGGNLSEVLDNISDTIRERQKIKNELKTLTAQGKLSGVIVTLIPIFLGLIIYVLNKEYILLLFTSTGGLVMVAISILNQILGLFVIRKIVNIDI